MPAIVLRDLTDVLAFVRGVRDTIRFTKEACAPSDDDAQGMPAELVDAILAATTTARSR